MSKISNNISHKEVNNDIIPSIIYNKNGINRLADSLAGNHLQSNIDVFSSEESHFRELNLAGTPNVILIPGTLSEKYLNENGYTALTENSANFELGEGEDKGKYTINIKVFHKPETNEYTYGIRVYQNGKEIDTKDNAELNAFIISNYGFSFEQLLSEGHIDFDKNSKSYLLDLRPIVSSEEALSLNKDGGFKLIENEKPERTNRRFAVALIHSKFDDLIIKYSKMLNTLGALDFGFAYEGIKRGIQSLTDALGIDNFHYSALSRIQELIKKRDNICKSLEKAVDSPDLFNALYKDYLGYDYTDENFQNLRDIRHQGISGTENDSTKQVECYKEFEKLYPDNDVDKILNQWDISLTEKINTLGDIVIMILLTRGIGAGVRAAGNGVLKAIAKNNLQLAMSKFVAFTNALAQTTATMSLFEGTKTLVRGLTNREDLSIDEIIDKTVNSLGEGAVMGAEIALMEMFLISPITKAVSKRLVKFTEASEKIATKTAEAGSKGLPMEDAMQIYEESTKTMREAVHTAVAIPTLSLGFTGIESTKAHLGDFNAEEYRDLLIQQAKNQEEIDLILAMSENELKTDYTLYTATEQLESMTTIEGIGILFKRVQASVIADKALAPHYTNIMKARLCTVEENGITQYELRTPDDKPLKFSIKDNKSDTPKIITKFANPEDAIASYSTLCIDMAKMLNTSTINRTSQEYLSLIKNAKTVDELAKIHNEIEHSNLSQQEKIALKKECYNYHLKLIVDTNDREFSKIDETKEQRQEEANDDIEFEELEKSYEKIAQEYEKELETFDEVTKKLADERVQRYRELRAPGIIIYNEQRMALDGIKEYKSLKADIAAIKDVALKNELLNDLDEVMKSESKLSFRARINRVRHIYERKTTIASQRLMNYIEKENPKAYEELSKNPADINNPRYKEVRAEFEKLDKFDSLIDKITFTNDKKLANELYEQYLEEEFVSDNPKIDAEIKERCRKINKNFDAKVFLPINLKEAGVALKMVYQELANFKEFAKADGEVANIPKVLNFMRTKAEYFDERDAQIGSYSESNNTITADGLTIEMIKITLRHELTHANTNNVGYAFPEWFDPLEDLDELFDAGARVNLIMYGLKNLGEYLAVVSEFDMSKLSDNFKEKLVKLGMPRYITKMQNPEASKHTIPHNRQRLFAELCIEAEYERLHGDNIDTDDIDDFYVEDECSSRQTSPLTIERRNKIREILIEVKEGKGKISVSELAKRAECKPGDIYNALKGDNELIKLFDDVKDSTRGPKRKVTSGKKENTSVKNSVKKVYYPEWKTNSEYLYNENPLYTKEYLKLKANINKPEFKELYDSIQQQIELLLSEIKGGHKVSSIIVLSKDNNHIGIVAEKNDFGVRTVTIKNWQGHKSNWETKAETEDCFQFNLDSDGKLLSANLSLTEFFEENDVIHYEYSYHSNSNGQIEVTSKRDYYLDIFRYKNNPNEPTSSKTETYIPENDSMKKWQSQEKSGIFLNQPIDYNSDKPGLMNSFLNLIKADKKTKPDLSEKIQKNNNISTKEAKSTESASKSSPSESIKQVLRRVKDGVAENLIKHIDRSVYVDAFNILKSNPENFDNFIKNQIESMARNHEKMLPETKEFLQNILKDIINSKLEGISNEGELNERLKGIRTIDNKDKKFFTKELFATKEILSEFIKEGFNKGQISQILNTPYQMLTPIFNKFDFKVDGRKKAEPNSSKSENTDNSTDVQKKKKSMQSQALSSILNNKNIQRSILELRIIGRGISITQIATKLKLDPIDVGKFLKSRGLLNNGAKRIDTQKIIEMYETKSPRTKERIYDKADIANKLGYSILDVDLVLRRSKLIKTKKGHNIEKINIIKNMINEDYSVPIHQIAERIHESDIYVRQRIAEEGLKTKEYLEQVSIEKLNIDMDIYRLNEQGISIEAIQDLFDCTVEEVESAIKRHKAVLDKAKKNKNESNASASSSKTTSDDNLTKESNESTESTNEEKTTGSQNTSSTSTEIQDTKTGTEDIQIGEAGHNDINDVDMIDLNNKTLEDLQQIIFDLYETEPVKSCKEIEPLWDFLCSEIGTTCTPEEESLIKDFIRVLEDIKNKKIDSTNINENKVVLDVLKWKIEIEDKNASEINEYSNLNNELYNAHKDFQNAKMFDVANILETYFYIDSNSKDDIANLKSLLDIKKSCNNLADARESIVQKVFEIMNPNIRAEAEKYVEEHYGEIDPKKVEEYINSLRAIQFPDTRTPLGDFASIIKNEYLPHDVAVENYLTIKQIFDKSVGTYNASVEEYNKRVDRDNAVKDAKNKEIIRRNKKNETPKPLEEHMELTTEPRPEIMFSEMYAKYKGNNSLDKKIMQHFFDNYYMKNESIAITKGRTYNNQAKKVVSKITTDVKKDIKNDFGYPNCLFIFDKFERALKIFVSSDKGEAGVKDNLKQNNKNAEHEIEVKITGTSVGNIRLYSKDENYIFDIYEGTH